VVYQIKGMLENPISSLYDVEPRFACIRSYTTGNTLRALGTSLEDYAREG
jgi:hypothetical protein